MSQPLPPLGPRVLCVCQAGNSRSVSLAYLLKGLRIDAIAAGALAATAETLRLLTAWADQVVLVAGEERGRLLSKCPEAAAKLLVWDIGADRLFRGFPQEYLTFYERHLSGFALTKAHDY